MILRNLIEPTFLESESSADEFADVDKDDVTKKV